MSTLRIISLIVAAIALIASLILGWMIMSDKKTLNEKFNASLDERFGAGTSAAVADKPALDKLTHFNARVEELKGKLKTTEETLSRTEATLKAKDIELDAAVKARQEAQAAKEQAEQKQAETEQRARTAEGNLENAQTTLRTIRDSLSRVQSERNELQQKLDALGDAPEKVKSLQTENFKLKTDLTSATAQVAKLQKEIEDLKKVSPDLVGSVVKADPSWSFIVMDLGKEHSTGIEGSNFFVYRGDNYKGEVKVTRADRRVSIADVVLLPGGARASSIASGDKVLASRATPSRAVAPVAPAPAAAPAPAPRVEIPAEPAPPAAAAPARVTPAPTPAKKETKPAPPTERKQNFGPGRKSPYTE